MKKSTAILLTVIFLFAACNGGGYAGDDDPVTPPETNTELITVLTPNGWTESSTPTATPEPVIYEKNLSPLELLGYFINDDGDIIIPYPSEGAVHSHWLYFYGEYNPRLLKENFSGRWRHQYAINSNIDKFAWEETNSYNLSWFSSPTVGTVNESVLVRDFDSFNFDTNDKHHVIWWLDLNEPEIMYHVQDLEYRDDGFRAGSIYNEHNPRISVWELAEIYNREPFTETNPEYFKPLELIGYYLDEHGDLFITNHDWEESGIETYEKYFFGSWDNWFRGQFRDFYVIDKSYDAPDAVYKRDDVIIVTYNEERSIFLRWIDINEPDSMHSAWVWGVTDIGFDKNLNIWTDFEVTPLPGYMWKAEESTE